MVHMHDMNPTEDTLSAPSYRLLLIDDDPVLLMALPDTLRVRLQDCVVDTANTPDAALQLVQGKPYDAIISDIRMPGMDGVTLTIKMRELQPSTPVILITGHGENGLRGKASAAGAYAFLTKPLDPTFIAALLQQALQERRSQHSRSCAAG
jgi:two-component system, sensor histidine kinase and response regulator